MHWQHDIKSNSSNGQDFVDTGPTAGVNTD